MIKESNKKRHKSRFISRYDQIMNQYYTCWYKPTDAVVKQRIWQQKQIDTLYTTGRPIFGQFNYE